MSKLQETVKKASHTMFGKIKVAELAKTEGGRKVVLRVAGIATGLKAYSSQYGDGHGLVGSFTCVNPETGEAIKAATLYLPEVGMGPLLAAVSAGQMPQFALDVTARLDENSPVGFSYTVTDLVAPEVDPVAALLEKAAAASPLALAAPAAPAEKPAAKKAAKKSGEAA